MFSFSNRAHVGRFALCLCHELGWGEEDRDCTDGVAHDQDGDSWAVGGMLESGVELVREPISAVKGVPSFARRRGKATLPRKPSREETPIRRPTCWWQVSVSDFFPRYWPRTRRHQKLCKSWWWCCQSRGRWGRAWRGWLQQGKADALQRTGILRLKREIFCPGVIHFRRSLPNHISPKATDILLLVYKLKSKNAVYPWVNFLFVKQ